MVMLLKFICCFISASMDRHGTQKPHDTICSAVRTSLEVKMDESGKEIGIVRRIHVERIMQNLFCHIDDIVHICCVFSKFTVPNIF